MEYEEPAIHADLRRIHGLSMWEEDAKPTKCEVFMTSHSVQRERDSKGAVVAFGLLSTFSVLGYGLVWFGADSGEEAVYWNPGAAGPGCLWPVPQSEATVRSPGECMSARRPF